jgi:hypothetical protein
VRRENTPGSGQVVIVQDPQFRFTLQKGDLAQSSRKPFIFYQAFDACLLEQPAYET